MERRRFFGTARVRNAPRLVAASLVGIDLGSPARRAGAFAIDLALFLLVATPVVIAIGVLLAVLQMGGLHHLRAFGKESDTSPEALAVRRETKAGLLRLLARRRPGLVPPEARAVIESGDEESMEALLEEVEVSLSIQLSSGSVSSTWDPETNEVVVSNDAVLGAAGRPLGLVPLFLTAFTLVPRLFRGRTPGKWLFGLAIVRTDGRPLGWWDAFSRAGGYAGSFGMLGLGFAEALWDPNRQAAHDKLADTLVIRAPRLARVKAGAP